MHTETFVEYLDVWSDEGLTQPEYAVTSYADLVNCIAHSDYSEAVRCAEAGLPRMPAGATYRIVCRTITVTYDEWAPATAVPF